MKLANIKWTDTTERNKSMQEFGRNFIDNLPQHISAIQIPDSKPSDSFGTSPRSMQIYGIYDIQTAMREVLHHPTTRQAEIQAENAFRAFLEKDCVDAGLLKFFNGWYETHKTTSLISAKIIMRLAGNAASSPPDQQMGHNKTMAHMYEVAKDDFGLGHKGHDGMYIHMATAFGAESWVEYKYKVEECDQFSAFLYDIGVAEHKAPLNSSAHNESILKAMMISVASETWNGREFNFMAQHIEKKLLSVNPSLANDSTRMRNAKGYVIGHAGDVENKHGLHALAAAQIFARTRGIEITSRHLQEVLLDYNERVGRAFGALHKSLM